MNNAISRERVIEIIRDYISMLPEPSLADSRKKFAHRSYAIWAAETLLCAVEKSRRIAPITVVEQFVWKMNRYSCSHYMFSVAHDIALDILDHVTF